MFNEPTPASSRQPSIRIINDASEDQNLDPIAAPAAWPYLYFMVSGDDDGNPQGKRQNHPNLLGRQPLAASWNLNKPEVLLVVSNNGHVASDLIRVDFQIRYCTYAGHNPHEGFTIPHANEDQGSTQENNLTLDFVPAHGSITIAIPLDDIAFCQNLYIRARVCGMFTQKTDPSTWNVLLEPAVVEAWKDV